MMRKFNFPFAVSILALMVLAVPQAAAQDDASTSDLYHPALSDRFNIGIGVFYPDKTLSVSVDGTTPGEEIEIGKILKLDDSQSTGAMNFRWRFGEKWSFWGQYWTINDSGGSVLTEDVSWGDIVFKEGTFAHGGVDSSFARAFFGRKFGDSPNSEFGVGAGLHWLELEFFLEGQVLTSEGDLEFDRATVDAAFPLPNIGLWYYWSWSPKWVLQTRLDWLSVSVGDYSGGLWNAQAGVNYALFKNFGLGLYVNYFSLDVDIDKTDWRGQAESKQWGPYLAITANW